MKISHKLNLMQLISAALLITTVAFGLNKLSTIGNELEGIAVEDIPMIELLTGITTNQLEQDVAIERALRAGDVSVAGDGMIIVRDMKSAVEEFNTRITASIDKARTMASSAVDKSSNEQVRNEYNRIHKKLDTVSTAHDSYMSHTQHIFDLIYNGEIAEASRSAQQASTEAGTLNEEVEGLLKDVEKFTQQSVARSKDNEHQAFNMMIGMTVLALLIGVAIGTWISSGIRRSINHTNDTMRQVADENDFTARAPETRDEFGVVARNFNHMMDAISSALREVSSTSTQLAVASEELSTVTEQSRSGIAQQKLETEQVATAMTEMTTAMHEVARNAAEESEAMTNVSEQANTGKRMVEQTISDIHMLSDEVRKAADVINTLAEDSQNIGSVLDVIKDIAEQTNLLALNAAIEAARAGEQGRGFSVVADEVRTLALRTQESTTQIQETIENLQARATQAVNAMSEGQQVAEKGVTQAAKAGESLSGITGAVATINDMTSQIASASEEQTAVSDEINRSVTTISEASEQMNAGAEHTARASHDIAQLASKLQASVTRFKLSA